MSIKTLRKRIALVAVSALGVGLLSVAPASAAALAANGINILSTVASTPGVCFVNDDASVDDAIEGESATIAATASSIRVGNTAGDIEGFLSISGPGRFTGSAQVATGGSADTITFGSGQTTVTFNTDNGSDVLGFDIAPTGVGVITVTTRATNSTGAVVDALTITVVASCSSGISVADSLFAAVSAANAVTGGTFNSNIDNSGATTVASGSQGYIRMSLTDAYGVQLTSGALVATATGANCQIGIFDATSGTASTVYALASGAGTTAVDADTGFADVVAVQQVSSTTPASCAVTVSFNGTNVGSKTFTFRGVPNRVTVSDVTIGRTSGKGYYRVTVTDSAGNLIPGAVISHSDLEENNAKTLLSGLISTPQGQSGLRTSSTADSTFGKTLAVTGANVAADSSSADGLGYFSCNSKAGTGMITVRALISSATSSYATSAPFAIACGGALDKWTISLDKATYAPGEIATLTVTGKDIEGAPVSTFTTIGTVEYAFGGMTAVTAPTTTDAFASGAGIKTYQFSVGTSEGSFVGTFKISGTTDTAAKTVQYKVAATSASVTNAEVLAAIVKLIASINKQIRQLQKQLRR